MDFPYNLPNTPANQRPLVVLAQYGRWRVITNGFKYIVFDGPDELVSHRDFRRGAFGTRQQAEDRAFSADNRDNGR